MTVHIYYEHKCADCQAFYIPYARGVACPNCGRQESDIFDFVSQAAGSLQFNLQSYGRYLPPAWYVGSLGDHCLRLLFTAFEAYRTRSDQDESFEVCVDRKLAGMDWGGQTYFLGHIRGIAIAVQAAMNEARHGS